AHGVVGDAEADVVAAVLVPALEAAADVRQDEEVAAVHGQRGGGAAAADGTPVDRLHAAAGLVLAVEHVVAELARAGEDVGVTIVDGEALGRDVRCVVGDDALGLRRRAQARPGVGAAVHAATATTQ